MHVDSKIGVDRYKRGLCPKFVQIRAKPIGSAKFAHKNDYTLVIVALGFITIVA